jgi:short-subunit dehydrogenase
MHPNVHEKDAARRRRAAKSVRIAPLCPAAVKGPEAVTRANKDKRPRVLISGGAGGVGLACAQALAKRGAELILCDIDGIGLSAAAEALGAFTRFCDAIDENSVAILAAEIDQKFSSIDVLINAAGRSYIRALAMMRISLACMPLLRRGSGRRMIVNVVPAHGFVPSDGMFPYCSSALAFERLSDVLAEQVKGTSIGCETVVSKLEKASSASARSPSQLYQLQRVDDAGTAERVANIVGGDAEPGDWSRKDSRSSHSG